MEQESLKKLIIAYVVALAVLTIALGMIGRVARRYAAYEGTVTLEPVLRGVAVEKQGQVIEEIAEVLRARLAHFVPSEGVRFWVGKNEIRLRVATRLNTSNLEKVLTKRGKLEVAIASDAQEEKLLFDSSRNLINPKALPEGTSLVYVAEDAAKQREAILVKNDTRWTVAPDDMSLAWTSLVYDSSGRHYAANILLSGEAAKRFAEMTEQNYLKRLAIFIDGECYATPSVRTFIDTHDPLYVARVDDKETADVIGAIVKRPFPAEELALSGDLKQSTSAMRWDYTYSALLIGKAARALGSVMLPCLALILIGYRFLRDKTTLSLEEFAAAFFKTVRSLRRLAPAAMPFVAIFLINLFGASIENIVRDARIAARFHHEARSPYTHEQLVMGLAQRISNMDPWQLLRQLHLGNPSVLSNWANIFLPLAVIALYLVGRRRLALYADTPLAPAASNTRIVLAISSIAAIPVLLYLATMMFMLHSPQWFPHYVAIPSLSLLIAALDAIVCAAAISLARQRLEALSHYSYAPIEKNIVASFTRLFTFFFTIALLFYVLSFPSFLFPRLTWTSWITRFVEPAVKLLPFVPLILVLESRSLPNAVKDNFRLLVRQLPAIAALLLLGTTVFFILEPVKQMTLMGYRGSPFSFFARTRWTILQIVGMLIGLFFFFLLFMLFRAAREKAAHAE